MMSIQVWANLSENQGEILVLLEKDVYQLRLARSAFSFEHKFHQLIEALEQGKPPHDAGATSVTSLELSKIAKAVIAPGNTVMTLRGENGAPKMTYATGEKIADQIFQAILDRSGRAFESKQEKLGVGEALILPAIWGVLVAILWVGLYGIATDLVEGKKIQASGRQWIKDVLVWVANALGTSGAHAVGVVLLLPVLFWAGKRIMQRPQRTVWLPTNT
jgi:hypothetical protein